MADDDIIFEGNITLECASLDDEEISIQVDSLESTVVYGPSQYVETVDTGEFSEDAEGVYKTIEHNLETELINVSTWFRSGTTWYRGDVGYTPIVGNEENAIRFDFVSEPVGFRVFILGYRVLP